MYNIHIICYLCIFINENYINKNQIHSLLQILLTVIALCTFYTVMCCDV